MTNRNAGDGALSSDELLSFLERPATYPRTDGPFAVAPAKSRGAMRAKHVERIETHISWVFLTEHDAWKFKKPVRFEFLDFSTLEARRRACEAELQLNRRLAPGIYLGLAVVTRGPDGALRLENASQASGAPLEYGVHMRRLPADRTLDQRISHGTLNDEELEPLAEHLTRFYAQAAPIVLSPEAYRDGIEQHVRANQAELSKPEHGFAPRLVQRVHAAQLQLLRLRPQWFFDRALDGRVIDGHGDLRPEHICLPADNPPAVFDCLEFSADLRRIDVADELAFLGMECDMLGAHDVGARMWNRYAERSGDRPPAALMDFYRAYRACVRAKVLALRARQLVGEERLQAAAQSARYLERADRYGSRLGQPLLLIVRGLSGSGKSTLARAAAESLGATVVSTDELRLKMSLAGDRYSRANRDAVYQRMLDEARGLAADGVSIVLDGTFLERRWRERAVALGAELGLRTRMVRCECPIEVARERIAARLSEGGSASEARPELIEHQQDAEEPDVVHRSVPIDGTLAISAQVQAIEQALEPAG